MSKKKDFTQKNPALDGYTFSVPPLEKQAEIETLTETAPKEADDQRQHPKFKLPERKTERINLLVTPTIKKAIESSAAFYGLSVNAYVGHILKDYIDREAEELNGKR